MEAGASTATQDLEPAAKKRKLIVQLKTMSADEVCKLLDRHGLGELGKKLGDIGVGGRDLHEYFLNPKDGLRSSSVMKRALLHQVFDAEHKPKNVFLGSKNGMKKRTLREFVAEDLLQLDRSELALLAENCMRPECGSVARLVRKKPDADLLNHGLVDGNTGIPESVPLGGFDKLTTFGRAIDREAAAVVAQKQRCDVEDLAPTRDFYLDVSKDFLFGLEQARTRYAGASRAVDMFKNYIGRKHGYIEFRRDASGLDGNWYVCDGDGPVDLGGGLGTTTGKPSQTGIWVNGVRVVLDAANDRKQVLRHGDTVVIGDQSKRAVKELYSFEFRVV